MRVSPIWPIPAWPSGIDSTREVPSHIPYSEFWNLGYYFSEPCGTVFWMSCWNILNVENWNSSILFFNNYSWHSTLIKVFCFSFWCSLVDGSYGRGLGSIWVCNLNANRLTHAPPCTGPSLSLVFDSWLWTCIMMGTGRVRTQNLWPTTLLFLRPFMLQKSSVCILSNK